MLIINLRHIKAGSHFLFHLSGAERNDSWPGLSVLGWRSALRCWWCPTTAACCSVEDTGTVASESPSWGRASWWAGSAGTLVRSFHWCMAWIYSVVLIQHFCLRLFLLLFRRCYLLGSGSVRYLPHLWFKGHLLHRVAGSAAGELLASFPPSRLFSCARHTAKLTPFPIFRGASPAACLHGRCRFSVDMTRRSPVWLSAQNWTWLCQGRRSEMTRWTVLCLLQNTGSTVALASATDYGEFHN